MNYFFTLNDQCFMSLCTVASSNFLPINLLASRNLNNIEINLYNCMKEKTIII